MSTILTLDKFYTNSNTVEICVDVFLQYATDSIVEPSAGAGAFADYVDIMLDIEPESSNIIKQDFFKFDTTKYANYLGNPPFGTNASLAKKFFNHAAKGKGYIGFILPRTFRKVSVQNTLNLHFHLIEDVLLPENSFTRKDKPYSVSCVFQVWEYREKKREKIKLPITHEDFSFVKTLEEADFSIRRVGGSAGRVLTKEKTGAAPSHYFMKSSPEVLERLKSLYSEFQEVAKDTAGYPSLGKGELVKLYSISKNIS